MNAKVFHDCTESIRRIAGPIARRSRVSCRQEDRRALLTSERGQALAEFALVLPIVLLVLFGIIQFGLAINSENDETHIANELARYAIVNENPGEKDKLTPQEWATREGDNGVLSGTGEVCVTFPEGAEAGRPVKVEAKSTIDWIPLLKVGASTTLTGTAAMRLEASPSNYKAGCAKAE
jgi:Flp pilus assembly protein TadG